MRLPPAPPAAIRPQRRFRASVVQMLGASVGPVVAVVAVAASLAGTALSKRFLEAMSEAQYRRWAGRLVTLIAGYCVAHGVWLATAA